MAALAGIRVDTPLATTITWTLTTADTGNPVNVSEFAEIKCIHIVGAGTAQIRRSNDGVNFVNFGAAFATSTVNDFTSACKFIDINPVTVGSVVVVLTASKKALKI